MSAPSPVPCRSCDQKILWAKSEKGNAMCFDAEPSPRGRWDLAGPIARYVPHGQEKPDVSRYEAHWGSCKGRDRARQDYPRRKP